MAKNILAGLALVLLATSPALGDNAVGLLSVYDGTTLRWVTSSTLLWVTGTGDVKQLENAVLGGLELVDGGANSANSEDAQSKSVYVCRARHNGVWVSGQLRSKYRECIVSLHSSVHKYPKYEILQNLEGGAMLRWVPWDKFTAVPLGAVAGGQDTYETLVARKKVEQEQEDGSIKESIGYTHFIGKFDPKDGFGKMSFVDEQDKEIESIKGEILVETEPIRYELTGVKFNLFRKRVIRDPKFLAETILSNTAEAESINVDSALAYNSTHRLYWGQGHAILTGLNTTVRLTNGTVLENYNWGIESKEDREDIIKVEKLLEPGTACNVTLSGNYTEMDVPYTATLIAFYPDGTAKSRVIHGNKVEFGMRDVAPEYGPVYFLGNNSLVPTTSTTTTSTTSTTSTTTTEAPSFNELPENEVIQKKKKVDDESSIPIKNKGENQSMMNDDGGALSLKKKEDQVKQAGVVGSSSAALNPSAVFLLLASTVAVTRRLTM